MGACDPDIQDHMVQVFSVIIMLINANTGLITIN